MALLRLHITIEPFIPAGGVEVPIIEWAADSSVASSAGGVLTVQLTISSVPGAQVILPFAHTGSLVRGTDFYRVSDPINKTPILEDYVQLSAGYTQSTTDVYYEILTSSAGTIVLTLLDTYQGSVLEGATYGPRVEHTINVLQVGGGIKANFSTGLGTRLEGDNPLAPAFTPCQVVLTEPAPAGGSIVSVRFNQGNSTAVVGADFIFTGDTDQDLIVGYSIQAGVASRDFFVQVIGNDIPDQGDRIAQFEIIGATNGVTVGTTNPTFGLTIQEDDFFVEDPVIGFAVTGSTLYLNEADTSQGLSIPVALTGVQSPHGGFQVSLALTPYTAGGFPGADQGADYQVVDPPGGILVTFGPTETLKYVTLVSTEDQAIEGSEEFLATLSNPTGGATLGVHPTQIVRLIDNDAPPPNDLDGDLDDWLGNPLAPPRIAFDENDPHIIIGPKWLQIMPHPDTPLYLQQLQIVFGGTPGLIEGPDWNDFPFSAMDEVSLAGVIAEGIWAARNDTATFPARKTTATFTRAQDELALHVRIGIAAESPRGFFWARSGASTIGPDLHFYGHSGSNYQEIEWTGKIPGTNINTTTNGQPATSSGIVRDLVFYPLDFEIVDDIYTWSPIPNGGVDVGGITVEHTQAGLNTELVHNIRAVRLRLRPSDGEFAYVNVQKGPTKSGEGDETLYHGNFAHGRIILEDFQLRGEKPAGNGNWGTGKHNCKWGIKTSGRCALDIRHREQGMAWKALGNCQEHLMYRDSPTSDQQYPGIGGNYFLNLTNDWASGPSRTYFQVTNRRLENPCNVNGASGASNGDEVFVRAKFRGLGNVMAEGGGSYTWWGHDGRMYIKDSESLEFNGSLSGSGSTQYSGITILANPAPIQGAYAFEKPGDPLRLFAAQELVIDGFQISHSTTTGGRLACKAHGVRIVRPFNFDILDYPSPIFGIQSDEVPPGVGFTEVWDTSAMKYPPSHALAGQPYVGPFSTYPGWGTTPNSQKIKDGYHWNWGGHDENFHQLTAGEMDIYQQILDEQTANRIADPVGPPVNVDLSLVVERITVLQPTIEIVGGNSPWVDDTTGGYKVGPIGSWTTPGFYDAGDLVDLANSPYASQINASGRWAVVSGATYDLIRWNGRVQFNSGVQNVKFRNCLFNYNGSSTDVVMLGTGSPNDHVHSYEFCEMDGSLTVIVPDGSGGFIKNGSFAELGFATYKRCYFHEWISDILGGSFTVLAEECYFWLWEARGSYPPPIQPPNDVHGDGWQGGASANNVRFLRCHFFAPWNYVGPFGVPISANGCMIDSTNGGNHTNIGAEECLFRGSNIPVRLVAQTGTGFTFTGAYIKNCYFGWDETNPGTSTIWDVSGPHVNLLVCGNRWFNGPYANEIITAAHSPWGRNQTSQNCP